MQAAANKPALPWALAWTLAFGQIVAWGSLYYAFTVVVGPIHTDTGWSRTFLNAGLSAGLLMWGLCALPVGAWTQRHGGREVMAGASALGGLGLGLLGTSSHPALYVVAWLLLGVAMAGTLYEPAFAVITAAFGRDYRRGITLITLVGGLASTVFIPLTQLAVEHLGWRETLLALGGLQFVTGVPLHLWGLPRQSRRGGSMPAPTTPAAERWCVWWSTLQHDLCDVRFIGLAIWFTAHAAAFTGLMFQLVPIVRALGVEPATMMQAIVLIGPMQGLGRILLTTQGSRFSTLRVGHWSIAALLAAVGVLLLAPLSLGWLAVFAALYGLGNGVTTILRGTAIAELFGLVRYAELNGALSAPAVIAKAAAPLAFAGVWSATGDPRSVFVSVWLVVLVGAGGLVLAGHAQRRHGAPSLCGQPDPVQT